MNKRELSKCQKELVEIMQRLNFGHINGLVIYNGEPVFDPPPEVIREVKFCAENGSRPETEKKDFILKVQVRDLFAELKELGKGTIRSLEVKHGLPFRMTVEEKAA